MTRSSRLLRRVCRVFCAAAILAPALALAADGSALYFPGGVDRGDAMSVRIDPDAGTLCVNSDQFDATPCAGTASAPCFESGYMDFAAPPANGGNAWTSGGETFTIAGACRARVGGARITAQRIVSEQRHGRFEFYYDPTGNRLLGWRLDYTGIDGRPGHDLWMLKGVRRCRAIGSAG